MRLHHRVFVFAMRFRPLVLTVIALTSVMAGASLSLAGVADSPLPVLTSGRSAALSLFIVPAVMKVQNLDTQFTCTSLTTTSFKFAVQVFAADGTGPLNDVTAGNGTATLASGATQTISTGSTAGLHEDVVISGVGTSLRNGSARIVSESKAIACTAYVVDKFGTKRCGGASLNPGAICNTDADCTSGGAGSCRTTPDSMLELKLISKKKQKGE